MATSVESKLRQLHTKRRTLMNKAAEVMANLDKEFTKAIKINKQPRHQFVQSWNGRYNAYLGPIYKEVALIDTVINAIK